MAPSAEYNEATLGSRLTVDHRVEALHALGEGAVADGSMHPHCHVALFVAYLGVEGCSSARWAMVIIVFSPEHQTIGTCNDLYPVIPALKPGGCQAGTHHHKWPRQVTRVPSHHPHPPW